VQAVESDGCRKLLGVSTTKKDTNKWVHDKTGIDTELLIIMKKLQKVGPHLCFSLRRIIKYWQSWTACPATRKYGQKRGGKRRIRDIEQRTGGLQRRQQYIMCVE